MATNLKQDDHKIVEIAYGTSRVKLNVPNNFDIIEPKYLEGIENPKLSIENALKNPTNSRTLREMVDKNSKIAISVCDITRAQPRKIVLKTIRQIRIIKEN